MKKVLVLGSGQSAAFVVAQLLSDAEAEDVFVTVGDLDIEVARACVGDHPRGTAVCLDVNDAGLRSAEIERSSIVVNMLPAAFQHLVAWDCVNQGWDMLSVVLQGRGFRSGDDPSAPLSPSSPKAGFSLQWCFSRLWLQP